MISISFTVFQFMTM